MSFTASLDEIVRENRSGLLSTASHWERVRLGDIATILNGFPFPSARFTRSKGMPLLRIRDVGRISTEACFDGDFDPTFLVEPGELVVGMDGDFKAALWGGPRALLNQRVCKITPDEAVYRRRFLAYVLPGYLDAINAHTSSITVKHLSSRTVADIPLPLPPLPEQDRIIAALDALFTRLEAAVGALERVRANLKRYRASVLKAACEGRLVPTEAELARREGRDYEPADVLLQRILRERRARWEAEELERLRAKGKPPTDDRWKQKYKEPEAPDTSELPTLPEGWTWTSLDQLLYELRNGIATRPEGENGSRILRISAVRPLRVDLNDVRFLQEEGAQYVTYELREGDLLFTRYNGNPGLVGVCGAVTGITERTIYPDKLIRARLLGPDVRPEYVAIAVNTGYSRRFISSRVKTTAGQSGVAGADLKRMPVPLPPTREQIRIVEEVSRAVASVDRLGAEVDRVLVRAARLRLAVLERAFTGRLVPQDPNDEPASVLLERIRAQRQEQTELAIAGNAT